MSSTQIRKSVAASLIAICFLAWADQSASALMYQSPQNSSSPEPSLVIEVLLICDGMCGAQRSSRFRLLDDSTAEYLVSRSAWDEPRKDEIFLQKSIRLSKAEYDDFISMCESPGFWKSAVQYDSKLNLIDLSYLTVVTYRNREKIKKIYLKNYFPGSTHSAINPPDEVRQLVDRANKLSERIKNGGR